MKPLAPLALLALLAGCSSHSHHSVLSQVEKTPVQQPNGGSSTEAALALVSRVKVEGFDGLPEFYVARRSPTLEKFPCMKCHTKPLAQLQREQQGKKAAHWEVKLEHAPAHIMDCATCHLEADLDSLATLKRNKVDIDHAHHVCAQCHQQQVKDWAGGAHGKRFAGWAPPRVIASCAGCHNPHKPKLEPRLPVLAGRSPAR
jgi:hypothetical protein